MDIKKSRGRPGGVYRAMFLERSEATDRCSWTIEEDSSPNIISQRRRRSQIISRRLGQSQIEKKRIQEIPGKRERTSS